MGAGGSKVSDPFPVSKELSKRLDKLSYIAARILNTPDIYDVANLAKPGVCGDYVVFLRKGIEKKLLPFVAEVNGAPAQVLYQNPRKAFSDLEVRKKVCGQMVDTMLRAIITVLSCLASIQVESTSRVKQVEGIPRQVGGGISEVRDWLSKAGYVEPAPEGNRLMNFQDPGADPNPEYQFKLFLERPDANVVYGLISVDSTRAAANKKLPAGSLRVQFLNPIPLPLIQQAKDHVETVLPMRIVDNAGLPWVAGIFYQSVFKSFARTGHYNMTGMLERLFRKTMGANDRQLETREEISQADEVFKQLRRTQDPQVMYRALNQWFSENVRGFQPGYVQPQPPYGVQPPPYGVQPPPYGVQPYGYPQPQPQPQPQPLRPLGYGALPGLRPLPGAATGDLTYDIPREASKIILDRFKESRDLLALKSSPAHVRATTLAAAASSDRTVQTNVCSDPYWKEPSLAKIYPWAMLQLLCVRDWKTLGGLDPGKVDFFSEWDTTFLSGLQGIYGTAPLLNRPPNSRLLEQIRFTKTTDLDICKGSLPPYVRAAEVQKGLTKIQEIYATHVKGVWGILNDLIYTLEDPDTKTELVHLHPKVVGGTTSSAEYVNKKAADARQLLCKFYVDIEREYLGAAKNLSRA